jgi:F0F1-type ATP synthase assembly protein I
MTTPDPGGKNFISSAGEFLTLGIQLALAVVLFFFLGRWADEQCGTTPWLMIAGLFVGVTGGLISFFRSALKMGAEEDREAEEERRKRDHGNQA